MNVAIVTMVYNESVNLPLWVRHYSRQCPSATLFVIDHGTDDGSTRNLPGVNVVPLPRTPFDDQTRAEAVADFQHALLRFHDVVIHTDCDEMLVADPRRYPSLAAFLETVDAEVIAPVGLNVHQLLGEEGPIALRSPVLGQRRFVRFASSMCKPSIARVPLKWVPGFHFCDRVPVYRDDLYQFHLRFMDMALSLERLRLTRGMAWSARALAANWAPRQRQSDAERIRDEFESVAEHVRSRGAAPFDFQAEMSRLRESLRARDGWYSGEAFRGPIARIPEAFAGLI